MAGTPRERGIQVDSRPRLGNWPQELKDGLAHTPDPPVELRESLHSLILRQGTDSVGGSSRRKVAKFPVALAWVAAVGAGLLCVLWIAGAWLVLVFDTDWPVLSFALVTACVKWLGGWNAFHYGELTTIVVAWTVVGLALSYAIGTVKDHHISRG